MLKEFDLADGYGSRVINLNKISSVSYDLLGHAVLYLCGEPEEVTLEMHYSDFVEAYTKKK